MIFAVTFLIMVFIVAVISVIVCAIIEHRMWSDYFKNKRDGD